MSEHVDVPVPKDAWTLVAEGPDEFWVQGNDNWHCRVATSTPAPGVLGPITYANVNLHLRLVEDERLYARNPTRSLIVYVVASGE